MDSFLDSFEEFRPEPEEILPGAEPDQYLALVTLYARGKGSGVEVTPRAAHLLTVRDGKLVRFEVIPDLDEGRRAAGLT